MPDTSRTPASRPTEPIPFDERSRRVLELTRQVREGLYRPDPEEVARAILREWFEFGLELEREASPALLERPASRFIVPRTSEEPTETDATRSA